MADEEQKEQQQEPERRQTFQLQPVDGEEQERPAQPQMDWEKQYKELQGEYTRNRQRASAQETQIAELRGQLQMVQSTLQQAVEQRQAPQQQDTFDGIQDDDYLTGAQVRQVLARERQSMEDTFSRRLDQSLAQHLGPIAASMAGQASKNVLGRVQNSPLRDEVERRFNTMLDGMDPGMRMNPGAQEMVFNAVVGQMAVEGMNPLVPGGTGGGNGQAPVDAPDSSTVAPRQQQAPAHDPLIYETDQDHAKAAKYSDWRRSQGLQKDGESLQQAWNTIRRG